MDHVEREEMQGTGTIEVGYPPLQAATPAEELPARETDSIVDWNALQFQTTAELEPLDEIIGQSRAIAALEMGLGVQQPGYNIYAAGLTGTSKIGTIKDTLQRRLAGSPHRMIGSTSITSMTPINRGRFA